MNILIIEDENLAFKRIKRMLNEIISVPLSISHTDSIFSTIEWLNKNKKPDLLIMDIEISDGNSFEIFKHVTIDAPIIFTTAYNQFVMDAFKVNTVDYLLKPIKKDLLESAILKYEKYHTKFLKNLSVELTSSYKKQMVIKLGQKLIILPVEDIAYIYSKDKITYYCNTKNQLFPSYISLDKIQDELDPALFFRVNRQLIAHKKAITDIKTIEKSKLLLKLLPTYNEDVIVSTEKSTQFKKWLKL